MIRSYTLDGAFREQQFEQFDAIVDAVRAAQAELRVLPLDVIIALLSEAGNRMIHDRDARELPGVSYLALWLREEHLKKICSMNYLGEKYHETFTPVFGGMHMRWQPRGVVCHWIAENVPTLGFFSLAQAILSKNGSIAKVSERWSGLMVALLRKLQEAVVRIREETYVGSAIVRSIAMVSFPSDDRARNEQFSLAADSKVIWGSAKAIRDIIALPQQLHCENIVFGPKYSFGIFDRESIEGDQFVALLEHATRDVAAFNQMACSSPHVFFFERSRHSLRAIAAMMAACFERLPERLLEQHTPEDTIARIINARASHALDLRRDVVAARDTDWTILLDDAIGLVEPVQGKCITLKEVSSLRDVLVHITRKVQTVGVAIHDEQQQRHFADEVTERGVDRVVPLGSMHHFDFPWDGMLPLNRLVRWVALKDAYYTKS